MTATATLNDSQHNITMDPRLRHALTIEAEVVYRETETLELRNFVGTLDYSVVDPWSPEHRAIAADRQRIATEELRRRVRLFTAGEPVPDPHDPADGQWSDLVTRVKSDFDILRLFELAGYAFHDIKKTEAHAACLICGGTDRLVIFFEPEGRYYCRQCGLTGDVITAARNLIPELYGKGFRTAVAFLARELGLTVPTPTGGTYAAPAASRPSRRGFVEFSSGEMVTR